MKLKEQMTTTQYKLKRKIFFDRNGIELKNFNDKDNEELEILELRTLAIDPERKLRIKLDCEAPTTVNQAPAKEPGRIVQEEGKTATKIIEGSEGVPGDINQEIVQTIKKGRGKKYKTDEEKNNARKEVYERYNQSVDIVSLKLKYGTKERIKKIAPDANVSQWIKTLIYANLPPEGM